MNAEIGTRKSEGRILREAFVSGKRIVMREQPEVGAEYNMLADLHFAVACYLASDGSFGLYDAGTAIHARDEIMQIVSREAIDAIQDSIRSKSRSGTAPV